MVAPTRNCPRGTPNRSPSTSPPPSPRRSAISPRAVETRVAYQNPYADEWIETDRFNAIVEPSRLRDQALVGEADENPLFHVPSNSYTILNPVHVCEPLEEVLRDETVEGRPLGEVVFG